MVERKSTLTNNQEAKDYEAYSQFSEAVPEIANDEEGRQYGRDFMLQLRLHPLSLQRPRDLPDVEVIKEKLYLHHISDPSCTSADKHIETNHFSSASKSDYYNMKHEYPVIPPYFSKIYPYCLPPHMYNGNYQNASSKLRAPFHTYCNPLKKHSVANHPCYKDFAVDECLWAKRCYASSEDMWSSYPSHAHSNFVMKKNDVEAVPKSKKKLSIIDPVTGKNILEAVTKTSCEQQSNTSPADEILKSSDESNAELNGNSYAGDYFSNEASDDGSIPVANDGYENNIPCSSENKLQYEKLKDVDTVYQDDLEKDRSPESKSKLEGTPEEYKVPLPAAVKGGNISHSKDTVLISDSSTVEGNIHASTTPIQKTHDSCDAHKLFNKQVLRVSPNNIETNHLLDVHACCQTQHQKEKEHHHVYKDSASLQTDAMKEGFRQLREKIYALRQEQQKMTILQSFLRFKRYQLEETARNLDEKRIECANWECTLHNKAKRLQEKEQQLENKSDMLHQKAQELAEQEKTINAHENRITSEIQPSKNVSKDTCFSFKKFPFDKNNDIVWEGMDNKALNNSGNGETDDKEFIDFGCYANSCKVTEGSSTIAEKCKSEASAMDELEKNIVMMEKLHSSNETGDSNVEIKSECNVEIKSESISPFAVQKKNENVSEPAGYSIGRKYLPEHIKYWLNRRDNLLKK